MCKMPFPLIVHGKVIGEYVYPEHFGMASTEAERAEYMHWMEPVTHVYSKGMATPQEGAVSKASAMLQKCDACCAVALKQVRDAIPLYHPCY